MDDLQLGLQDGAFPRPVAKLFEKRGLFKSWQSIRRLADLENARKLMAPSAIWGMATKGIFQMTNATNISEKKEVAVFETTLGTIEIEVDRGKAPITAENFAQYVKSGFYDGLVFHRVISTFMIQGGGFTPDGVQKETSAPIKLEANNRLLNSVGTVVMARTNDPNSATSQFFINVADNGFLNYAPGNPGYAVFGEVVSGMDVVNKIKSVRTSSRGPYDDWPVEDVVITRAYMK